MKRWLAVLLMAISICAFAEDQGIPCNWESPDAGTQKLLDGIWQEAQKAAGKKAKTKRPKVCARMGAVPVEMEGRQVLLCGYYEPTRNDILACNDPEICGPFRCVLIHEFLHNIMGSGHEGHDEVMQRAGCEE